MLTIAKIVQKFEHTGSAGDVNTPVHARTAENIAAVRDSVAEEPSTSTRRRAQQLLLLPLRIAAFGSHLIVQE